MAFTQQDLLNVEKALSNGERRVKLGDKEVEYRSISEIVQLLKIIKRELNPDSVTNGRVYVSTGKGY